MGCCFRVTQSEPADEDAFDDVERIVEIVAETGRQSRHGTEDCVEDGQESHDRREHHVESGPH